MTAKKTKRLVFPNTRRLLKLAELLEQLPPRRFDYSDWVGEDWKGAKDLSCGTTACALGWATTVPKWGLVLTRGKSGSYVRALGSRKSSYADEVTTSIKAGARVFGLTFDEADYLFIPGEIAPYSGLPEAPRNHYDSSSSSPTRRVTAKDVARHIRRFVKFAVKNRDVLRDSRLEES